MAKPEKIAKVDEICEKIEKSNVCLFLHNKGMSATQADSLRKLVRNQNGEIKVYKNTLLKLALKKANRDVLESNILKGFTIVSFAYGDPVPTVKSVVDFQKIEENGQKLNFKAGLIQNKPLSISQIKALADLPSREILLSQLLNVMQAPASQLVGVLSAPMRDLVGVLNAFKQKKEENS